MDDRVGEALKVVGLVVVLLVWFGAASVLTALPLEVLPDGVVGLVLPVWLLLPFLVLGGYYYRRSDRGADVRT